MQKAAKQLEKVRAELQLTTADERVLLHLPKRGFPWLASFLDPGSIGNNRSIRVFSGSYSWLFMPETKLSTCSREEEIAGDVLAMALQNRAVADRYACFRLLKELAPSPEAMRLEKQAKELADKLEWSQYKLQWRKYSADWLAKPGYPTEADFLEALESIRTLFDQLKDLPKMSPEEFAREREESAVLAPAEYDDYKSPDDKRTWSEQRINRHNHWDHEGFLVAYSEDEDFARTQMVIKPSGGIFKGEQLAGGGTVSSGPGSYESKLPPADLHALEDYLKKMPPSNAKGEDIHFIVSFSENENWMTRTYSSLPIDNPFQPLLRRMCRQGSLEWHEDPSKSSEFLAPEQ